MMLDSPVTEGRHLRHRFFQVSSSHGRILSLDKDSLKKI
jgi:hypothetical protein